MRILIACANGIGTSLIIKTKIEQALLELNVSFDSIEHCSIAESKNIAANYDVIFCPFDFADNLKKSIKSNIKIIAMKNLLSLDEAKIRIQESGLNFKSKE